MTYLIGAVILLALVLAALWPANSRRWGTERAMPPDPVWDPWDYVAPEPVMLPARTVLPATYRVGEIIETHAPRPQIGGGR